MLTAARNPWLDYYTPSPNTPLAYQVLLTETIGTFGHKAALLTTL